MKKSRSQEKWIPWTLISALVLHEMAEEWTQFVEREGKNEKKKIHDKIGNLQWQRQKILPKVSKKKKQNKTKNLFRKILPNKKKKKKIERKIVSLSSK